MTDYTKTSTGVVRHISKALKQMCRSNMYDFTCSNRSIFYNETWGGENVNNFCKCRSGCESVNDMDNTRFNIQCSEIFTLRK
jgi:hypothetical protein